MKPLNIQTIPRKDKIVKAAFLPKLDQLLFADYSQIEYRMYAWYLEQEVGDSRAADDFRAGKDFHEETAKRIHEILGWEYSDPLTDGERQVGKQSNFAAIYSGGIPTIQRQLGCDRNTARRIADAFHEDNPALGRWVWRGRGFVDPDPYTLNGRIITRLAERKYITTLWGRHLHPPEARKGLNALIQGGAADLLKQAMVTAHAGLSDHGFESHMVLSVHDELGFDCVDREIEDLKVLIPQWMDDPILSETIPIPVDIKSTPHSWADAE